VIEITNDLMIDGSSNLAEKRVDANTGPNELEAAYLSEQRFNQLSEELIYTATAGGVLPSDALAALAKAIGVLAAFTARRDRRNLAEILCASQETVESFALAAETYMDKDPKTE
jgi:hypothetical protein